MAVGDIERDNDAFNRLIDLLAGTDGYQAQFAFASPTSLKGGSTTVSLAGTAVQLSTTLAIRRVHLKAVASITGKILVGDSTTQAYPLAAGETLTLEVDDLADVWVDSLNNGEAVDWVAEVK